MTANKKELAPLAFPKIGPEKMVRGFMFSKSTNATIKKFPEWDLPRVEPNVELVCQRRQLHRSEDRLIEKKEEAQHRRISMDAQWTDLEEKEKLLNENFIKFNKFVKENQEKRERAERKISEETGLIEKRDIEIDELEGIYVNMHKIKTQMEQNIKSHRMYEGYLMDVVKMNALFRTPDNIIDRFEALAEARTILAERQEVDLRALEDARNEMMRITEAKSLIIMGLHNKLAELQSRYEVAKNKALQWELMVGNINNTCVERLVEIQQVRQSSWNIYTQMCKRKETEREFAKDDLENQLSFIKWTMMELKRVTKTTRKRANKESYTSK